eukprot:scaffold113714_cov48-Phaeocystis_antarctica.AAC.1
MVPMVAAAVVTAARAAKQAVPTGHPHYSYQRLIHGEGVRRRGDRAGWHGVRLVRVRAGLRARFRVRARLRVRARFRIRVSVRSGLGLGWHGVSLIRPARRGPNSPLPAVAPRVGEGEVAASWEDGVRGAVWRAPIRHQPEPIAGEFP